MGHLMRCLALSEELTRRGNICYFLSKTDNHSLVNIINKFGINHYKIKSDVTIKEDLDILLTFSHENHIDWVITDSYVINSCYIRKIKQNEFCVLSIDDTVHIHYFSDIVLNQNAGAEKLVFSAKYYTKFLLGSKYVMLRDELLKREKKIRNSEVKKILITFGGSDYDNVTLRILQLLESINKDIEILVLLGPFNHFYEEINAYIKETNSIIKLIKNPASMAEVYMQSDIAISAGGSSCYELAYYGIPNIITVIADNQLCTAQELHKQKVSIYLGKRNELNPDQFKAKINELILNSSLRKKMSRNGRILVDGKGKRRIVDFMEKLK